MIRCAAAAGRDRGLSSEALCKTMPSSKTTDYDALAATTSIEDMAEDGLNKATLRSLKDDDADLCHLGGLCSKNMAGEPGDYYPGSSEELGWLGHFAKKSTRLEGFTCLGMTSSKTAANNLSLDSSKTSEETIASNL